jgi:photosystem II stability/assembly factor-like uncharacterized protein
VSPGPERSPSGWVRYIVVTSPDSLRPTTSVALSTVTTISSWSSPCGRPVSCAVEPTSTMRIVPPGRGGMTGIRGRPRSCFDRILLATGGMGVSKIVLRTRWRATSTWLQITVIGVAARGLSFFGAGLTGTSAAASANTQAAWTLQASYPQQPRAQAVSCPSSTECFAVGTGLFESVDGGDTWTSGVTPPMSFSDIDCPSTSVCFAAGSSGAMPMAITTTDGGNIWSQLLLPSGVDSNGAIDVISCSTTLDCSALAGSQYFLQTTDGGSTWNLESIPAGDATGLSAMACPTSSTCFASDT